MPPEDASANSTTSRDGIIRGLSRIWASWSYCLANARRPARRCRPLSHPPGPSSWAPPEEGWIDWAGMLLLCLIAASVYLQAYRLHPANPHGADGGWWTWFDQGWYFKAAKAWAAGNLDPRQHFYLPGYSLLGAAFVPFLSGYAFAAVDLICLLASLWLFSRIAVRLLPSGLPHAALVGAAVFAVTATASPDLREVWVVPWSSSGSTPFTYAALLAVLRFIEAPPRPGRVFWVGLAGGAIAAFRPFDAVLVGLACGLGIGIALPRLPQRRAVASIGYGLLGLTVSLGLLAAVYTAIYGLHEAPYVQVVSGIGFEWRLLPLSWVTLGLDPRPLYDEGRGMIAAFPWVPVGLAVFPVYILLFVRSTRWPAHIVIITATSLHILFYLTYRYLSPDGLFRFENYHYFKLVIPICSLYCVIFCCDLILAQFRRRLLAASIVVVGLCLLLPWRAQFDQVRPIERKATLDPFHTLVFESGLTSVNDAVLATASGPWDALYGGKSTLVIGGHTYTEVVDYKIHPILGGFFVVPLRPLATGPARLTVDPAVTLDPTVPALYARQSIVFGWPCWLFSASRACARQPIILPPALSPSGEIPVNGTAFLFGAWSGPQPPGRWTDGNTVSLRVRPPAPGALQLEMQLSAFVPPGSEPLRASVSVGSQVVAERVFQDYLPTQWTATIPADLTEGHPAMVVTITIANPRRPSDSDPDSGDKRRLGLFFTAMRLAPVKEAP